MRLSNTKSIWFFVKTKKVRKFREYLENQCGFNNPIIYYNQIEREDDEALDDFFDSGGFLYAAN